MVGLKLYSIVQPTHDNLEKASLMSTLYYFK